MDKQVTAQEVTTLLVDTYNRYRDGRLSGEQVVTEAYLLEVLLQYMQYNLTNNKQHEEQRDN